MSGMNVWEYDGQLYEVVQGYDLLNDGWRYELTVLNGNLTTAHDLRVCARRCPRQGDDQLARLSSIHAADIAAPIPDLPQRVGDARSHTPALIAGSRGNDEARAMTRP
jgi:hypothetical protein